MSSLTATSTVPMRHSAKRQPVIALGVYQSTGAYQSSKWAFQNGYTHIDSARVYRNEEEVVKAFLESGLKRSDVWLTTKVQGREHGTKETKSAVESSNQRIGEAGPWDLVLLHDPTAGKKARLEAWKVLLEAKAAGEINAIGVSNFGVKHMKEVHDEANGQIEVNQVEIHPWCQQREIVEYCQKEGIVVQAYCPLVRGQKMKDPVLVEIAKRHARTPAQVLVRWSLQKGFVPLPKSDHEDRIKENMGVFGWELDGEGMKALDALDEGDSGAVSWNPTNVA